MQLYAGVAIYKTLVGSRVGLHFAEAISEEEAKSKIFRESYEYALKEDPKAGGPVVIVTEVPQDMIDKYSTVGKAGVTNGHIARLRSTGEPTGPEMFRG